MATKTIATATVRAVKRKLIPTRAAITLVSSGLSKNSSFRFNYDCKLFLDTISNWESESSIGRKERVCKLLSKEVLF